MFNVDLAHTITSIKDCLLPPMPYRPENAEGLMITATVSMDWYGYEKDGNTKSRYKERHARREIAFVFTANTTVCAFTTDNLFDLKYQQDFDFGQFEHLSDHDSCWRDAVGSYLSKLSWAMYEEVYGHLPKRLKPTMAESSQFCTVAGFRDGIKKVKLSWERQHDPIHGHHRKGVITSLVYEDGKWGVS